jgi:signal transduction histidine kinase
MSRIQAEPSFRPKENVLENVEHERQRIARDLHDSIGGMLATALLLFDGVDAQNAERFQKVKEILRETQREVRRIAHGLSPAALNKLGLVPALEQLADEINNDPSHFIDLKVINSGFFTILDKSLQINTYRMAQELLQNALKHADASYILLSLEPVDGYIVLQYEDDGIGADDPKMQTRGLRSLRERVRLVNGKMKIRSNENEGMTVRIEIPL